MQTFIIKEVNIYILLITELLFICYLFVNVIDSTARWDTAETDGYHRIFLENEQNRRTIEPICWCKLCSHGYIFIVYQIKKEIIWCEKWTGILWIHCQGGMLVNAKWKLSCICRKSEIIGCVQQTGWNDDIFREVAYLISQTLERD